ncbi:MAG: Txe/YoeB family addiction module toxin [Tannerellaceae bacterium]
MGKYTVEVENAAKKELAAHYKSGDKKTIKRIERIFQELAETPYEGIGSPEPLKYKLSGYWSRQINKKDRLVYRVDEEIIIVYVVSALGHYDDK